MPNCSPVVFDIGPGILQVALQLLTILTIYLGVNRIQSVVQGQQLQQAANKAADKAVN